jgi:hypothetical protein
VLTEKSTVTGANNLIVLGLRRWFGVVDSSCWFVDVHCKWFQFSSEEPVLTEISTVTGANNLILLGLRRWFGVVDSSCWCVDVHCRWCQFSSEKPVLTEISSTNQQLESTTLNYRRRPNTIKLLAPVTVDISVSTGSSELS